MSGATISCASGGGFAGALDTQTIVNGATGSVGSRFIGWSSTIPIGSIVSGNSPIYSSAAITNMYYDEAAANYILTITGTLANSGWTNIVINRPTPTTLLRASATFSQGGGVTTWTWPVASTPIGIGGATYAVGFN